MQSPLPQCKVGRAEQAKTRLGEQAGASAETVLAGPATAVEVATVGRCWLHCGYLGGEKNSPTLDDSHNKHDKLKLLFYWKIVRKQ